MYKLCKTEQSAKRQRKIERAMLEMLKTRRFEDLTVTELCEYVGMPRKAFYRYFDSKEDTLDALIEHTLGEYVGFEKDFSGLPNRRLQSEIEEYFSFWRIRKPFLDFLERNGLMGILVERSIRYPVRDRVDMDKFQPNRDDFTKELVLKFAFSGLIFVMLEWYKSGFKASVEDMAAVVCNVFTKPLFPNLSELGINV